jgi:DNA repair protein RecN (Recombination protein N)
MLALKLALSEADPVPTMVFDGIDSGVSGRVAEAVGDKLLQLSERRQVIVITHLPQIAGKAVRHFSARKTVEKGATKTGLVVLDDAMRQRELATMLSGQELTEAALAQARELLKKGQSPKR